MFNKLFKKGISKDQIINDDTLILSPVDLISNKDMAVDEGVLDELLNESISYSLLRYVKGTNYINLFNEFTTKYPCGISTSQYRLLKGRYDVLDMHNDGFKVDIRYKRSTIQFTLDSLVSKLTDDAMEQQNG